MEKTFRSLLRILWIITLFLTLICLSANTVEIKTFLGQTGILTRRANSEASIGAAVGRYHMSIIQREGNRLTNELDKGVVLALVGNREDNGAMLGVNDVDR